MALTLTNHSLFSKDKFFPLRGFFYAQPDMPPHKQEFTEVIFILKGKVLHYSDPAGWEESAAGDVWLIPPGGIHGYLKAENLQIFNLLFIADQLPVPLLELYRHPGYKKLFSRDNSSGKTRDIIRAASGPPAAERFYGAAEFICPAAEIESSRQNRRQIWIVHGNHLHAVRYCRERQ